ncbi:MAG: FecR domain-containing protein [Kofleriaceae bacterium]|nr:FecR domain-containing protein [Kofleriaceae bacterium]
MPLLEKQKQNSTSSRLRSRLSRMETGALTTLLLTIALLIGLVPSVQAQPKKTRVYVVKARDTCVRIAGRELGNRGNYKLIHVHNSLGPLPHKLKPGQKLNLPILSEKSQAVLSVKRGPVRFRPAAKSDWDSAKPGMDLYKAWRVNSRKQAAAELTFRDNSKLTMRENTVVIVYGRSSQRKASLTRAVLKSGSLRTRLSELSGGKRLMVETPSSEAEVGKGSTLISVDSEGTSRIANHKGEGVTVRSKSTKKRRKRAKVRVAAGFGSKVKVGLPPSKPKALPPAPTWLPGRMAGIGFASTGASVGRGWKPVAVASSYRVEIARSKEMNDIVATVVAPSNVTKFVAHGLPKGRYFVRVSSIDDDGFESVPSVTEIAQVYELSDASSGTPAESPPGSSVAVSEKTEVITVPNGTNLEVPDGITCSLGAALKKSKLMLLATGPQQIVCSDSQGELGPLMVEVAAPTAQPSLRLVSKAGSATVLAREVSTTIELELRDHVTMSGQQYEVVSSSPDVVVEIVVQAKQNLQVRITPGESAGQSVDLVVRVAGQGDSVPLATTTLAISPKPEVAPEEPAPTSKLGGSLSLFGVGAKRGSNEELGGGFRLAAHFSQIFAEGEMLMVRGNCERPFIGCELSFRGHLGFNLVSTRRVDLFGLAGLGTRTKLGEDDIDLTGHYGAGARYNFHKRLWLRADARHVVAPGDDTFEFHLGIQQSFGAPRAK